jgi:hypothetical protein
VTSAADTDHALAQIEQLPRIDEHAVTIDAGVADVWRALVVTLDRSFTNKPASVYARVVGCREYGPRGPRPLAAGSTIPGFRVVCAVPDAELVLDGQHRFSNYALTFRLESIGPQCTRLRADTRAAFPGVTGAAYRALVIGTRGHVVAVRRLLSTVRRRAMSFRLTVSSTS